MLLNLWSWFIPVAVAELCFSNATSKELLKTTFMFNNPVCISMNCCAAAEGYNGASRESWHSSVINFIQKQIAACFKWLVMVSRPGSAAMSRNNVYGKLMSVSQEPGFICTVHSETDCSVILWGLCYICESQDP